MNTLKTYFKPFSILMILLFGVYQQSNAQLLQRAIKRGVNRAVERKVEKEAEKQTEKALDSIFQSSDKEVAENESDSAAVAASTKRSMGMMQKMLGGINSVELPAQFAFDQRIVWEIEDEKGEKMEMDMFYHENSTNFGMNYVDEKKPKNQNFIVMNFEEGYMAMFMNNDGEKQKMTMPLNQEAILAAAEESAEKQSGDNITIEKTGKTKTILGYHCEEYLITTEDYIQHTWITEDYEVATGMQGFFKQAFDKNKKVYAPQITKGFPMEIEMIRKKNKKTTYMRTKSIDKVNEVINTADYPALAIGG
ncbi:DUF4412 domain-containing protein [Membranihabitans marinus]|uniref:DUF4412 domain-containing protein n=1 Tax=Membranihabitans marinus TaxID=1227546 RepID=UPI001F355A98|nr:DUF4412 domain-containing protein [Membranihabitans marinus]